MGIGEDFQDAASKVKNLKGKPVDEEMLELYSLYKQAECGDNETPKPGMFDFKGGYKWEAWNKKKGLSKEDAQKNYIEYVNTLIAKYGVN